MDAAALNAAQSSALEFCQQQLRQAAVYGQGLLQRVAELTADAECREAEMQALRERCSDLQNDNERLRHQISACKHQFDMEILQSRCDELTVELERCQRGLHLEDELLQARQQLQVLQQACDSDRRMKQASEQKCDALARELSQYREMLTEAQEDKTRMQASLAVTRQSPSMRKNNFDVDALVTEVRDLKAQLEDARRLNSLMRIASLAPDTSSPVPAICTNVPSQADAVDETSKNDNSASSKTTASSPRPLQFKELSWPPQPDESPPSSCTAPSAPQILRDFFALSVVCCCMAQPDLHTTADINGLMSKCLQEEVPLHEWRDWFVDVYVDIWIHHALQFDPAVTFPSCRSPSPTFAPSSATTPHSSTKKVLKSLEKKRLESNCVRMVQAQNVQSQSSLSEASLLVTKILTVNAGLESELEIKSKRAQEADWEIQELKEVVAAKNDVISHLMESNPVGTRFTICAVPLVGQQIGMFMCLASLLIT